MPFSFYLSFIIIFPFYMEIKKTLHVRFAFNSNSPQIEHIVEKNTKRNKKKSKWEGPTNKSTKISQIIF
jgi:hypothetical protein